MSELRYLFSCYWIVSFSSKMLLLSCFSLGGRGGEGGVERRVKSSITHVCILLNLHLVVMHTVLIFVSC